ncbi:amidohydrolase family protein [Natronobacterium texcoconense]|uniref:Predicted metal-dependent hydrolase, TIM-barrel fold n=1 Tax=Natronobacterium texcoconense TaxID=1095778 RepID=A0A1H1C7R6_NATTX|nr:amidohydrolase family protein [Natronobacterium texcoconense]SDQ59716.1 Predicted metal-dependent hydrolase, TIM-barrel fold [Natronobacterium texcoconense]
MTRFASPSGDSSSCSDESDDSNADDTRSRAVTTRRRYLGIAAGGLFATGAGCTTDRLDESTPASETPEPSAAPPDDPETDESDSETEEEDTETEEDDQDPLADLPLFDAHTHVVPMATRGHDPLSADELVDWMDAYGVDRAVVLAFDSPEAYPVQAPSWWVLEEAASYPERLVPFCTIDPRTLVYGEDTAEDLLEGYIDRGARGFGELKVGMPIDDERLGPIYERCAEYELPILFHTDRQSLPDEIGLPRLESVLASYPEVDFVAHAHGWWAHMGADVERADLGSIPEGPIESRGRIWELLAEYDNIYGDISTRSGWNALVRDETLGQELLETHHDQIVFGTDYLYPGQAVPQFGLFDRFDLDREAWANVRHRNIERLLR